MLSVPSAVPALSLRPCQQGCREPTAQRGRQLGMNELCVSGL